MASGKSRTGRALAERLGRTFVDTDAVIVERAGKSITDIFAQDGEAAFRQMERDIIAEIARNEAPQVVSLGGGALNQPENLKVIRESGTIIRLWASPEILSERIGRKLTLASKARTTRPRRTSLNALCTCCSSGRATPWTCAPAAADATPSLSARTSRPTRHACWKVSVFRRTTNSWSAPTRLSPRRKTRCSANSAARRAVARYSGSRPGSATRRCTT